MSRCTVALPTLLCWLVLTSAAFRNPNASGATPESKPNLLVILADDLGRGDYSAFGTPDIRTPAIDRLFREGLEFVNFRASSPVCSPTRAALLTGMHPDRAGVPGVIRSRAEDSFGYLRPDVPLLPRLLKPAGYQTALIGKWHLGLAPPNLPNLRGFDFFQGFLADMMDDYWTHRRHGTNYMRLNGSEIDPAGHATDLFTDWACEYIRNAASGRSPFFLYLAYNAPHDPIQPPPRWIDRVKTRQPGISEKRAKLVALIEHLDSGIGKVLAALNQGGLAERTVVIFPSDNGGVARLGANNGPWSGEKGHVLEGGLRVPFAVRWPNHVRAGSTNAWDAYTPDIFPTCCELAGVPVPAGLDGMSLLPAFSHPGSTPPPRDFYFVRREGGMAYGGKTIEAIIRGDWKLLQDSPYQSLRLFNLKADPRELSDRSQQDRAALQSLSAALMREIQRGGAVPWQSGP